MTRRAPIAGNPSYRQTSGHHAYRAARWPAGTRAPKYTRGAPGPGARVTEIVIVMSAFMSELITTVEIDAPRARVWATLTDFPRYPEWNPYIRDLAGELVPGGRLTITLAPLLPAAKPRVFRPIVLDVQPGVEFRWVGVLHSPRTFRGEHYFRLESLPGRRSRLVQGEYFSGLFHRLHRVSRYYSTKRGFERMNAALKLHAERHATAAHSPGATR